MRIDSQQYVAFLEEVMASYPKVDPISVIHNKYPCCLFKKWLGDNIKMSIFDSWPPASGDLMPMNAVFTDILKEFEAKQILVHSEKDLYKEVENCFLTLTENENYANSLISNIPLQLQQIVLKNEEPM
ncbi:Uncharacterized protein APZ42_028904 [Daphnia magna]|uniref:Uncharacterized protein n=1 Tax=Daphnia magna TaxID=35525 RepID=A0A164Q1U3_9CRUS|nr:Uncharacterized protein APZ42_028904 [Daphnia magna]